MRDVQFDDCLQVISKCSTCIPKVANGHASLKEGRVRSCRERNNRTTTIHHQGTSISTLFLLCLPSYL